jgi:CheY-like chemotaxis protein
VVVDCSLRPAGRIRISVSDSGVGIAPEKLAQLFQPFNRLGKETSSVAGTGIGLVVTKRLAELMDAVLGVESTIGSGSVFWCDLMEATAPHISVNNGESEEFVRQIISPDSSGTHVRTLLYVEDNPANLELVEQLIARQSDIRLISAVNGIQAIEIVRNDKPDLILMDINLPGISGIDVMKILHENPATEHIPIVALSANAMPRDIKKGLEAGFYRYLTKPIKVNEFMETLNLAFEFSKNGFITDKKTNGIS